ncbi:hypothetical protein LQF12_01530 [Ruania suaedae]|uniref:hypothetical protein n=1 Tax=Ruania suaedae TaxID=2897774 RepID=UPI001E43F9DC|nr:hypothetical protein [Ruania suaedae]UFU03321.1 hypothetical protein LQF12_01530 [Ruania suaedae]
MRRHAPLALAVLVAVLTSSGCTDGGSGGPVTVEPCDRGTPPPTEPGERDPLLTIAVGQGPYDLTRVVYEDGWVLSLADAAPEALAAMQLPRSVPSPYDDGPMAWQIGYLGECALTQLTDLAERAVSEDVTVGSPMITDQPTTYLTRYGEPEPVTVAAYALDRGQDVGGLDPGQQAAREELRAVERLAGTAIDSGEVLAVTSVRIWGRVGADLPADWPGPPLADIVGDGACGELTGEQARAVYEYLSAEPDGWGGLYGAVVPPGLPAC